MVTNMKKVLAAASALALAGTGIAIAPLAAQGPAASQWSIGPWVKGRNHSVGMPSTMSDGREGAFLEFPTEGQGSVHYVTVPVRSLQGARSITLRYRVDAARGVRFVPTEFSSQPATVSLYFQRAGDGWTGRTPMHRWYAPSSHVMTLKPGTYSVTVPLSADWIAMNGSNARAQPGAFAAAVDQAANVGFVFGSSERRGHGVFATGPARFTVLDYSID